MAYFNEIYNSGGKVRPHYVSVTEHWETISKSERAALHKRSLALFDGDYAQDPMPRIITSEEFVILKSGVEQRARAILAFINDYCSGGKTWSRIIPRSIFNAILERHACLKTLSLLKPEQISFPYGPDIIRDRHGSWKVVEDSAGVIGGIGDLLQSRKIFYKLVPYFRGTLGQGAVSNPQDYYSDLAKHFKEKAKEKDGMPLLYLHSKEDEPDQETQRLARVFTKLGIECVSTSNRLRKIVVKKGSGQGVFLEGLGKKERIGSLIFHASPECFKYQGLRSLLVQYGAMVGKKLVTVDFSKLQEFAAPSFESSILSGQTWTNFSPGVRFINDKLFGMYIDQMIRKFLKAEPIIESLASRPVGLQTKDKTWKLDPKIVKDLRRDKDRYVVKKVNEDGGSGVWIGQKQTKESIVLLIEKLRECPENYIIQEFEHLSVLAGKIVDLRLHAHVDADKIIVSNTPWGRAKNIRGNGKVNIGSNGITSPVLVLKGSL